MMKVYNKKYAWEVVCQFKAKYNNILKEVILLLAYYHPEKDNSWLIIGKEISEFQRMIGIFQYA